MLSAAELELVIGAKGGGGDVRLVVHAGDLTDLAVVRDLAALAPVVTVRGNNDRQARLDLERVPAVDGGWPRDRGGKIWLDTLLQTVAEEFFADR